MSFGMLKNRAARLIQGACRSPEEAGTVMLLRLHCGAFAHVKARSCKLCARAMLVQIAVARVGAGRNSS